MIQVLSLLELPPPAVTAWDFLQPILSQSRLIFPAFLVLVTVSVGGPVRETNYARYFKQEGIYFRKIAVLPNH